MPGQCLGDFGRAKASSCHRAGRSSAGPNSEISQNCGISAASRGQECNLPLDVIRLIPQTSSDFREGDTFHPPERNRQSCDLVFLVSDEPEYSIVVVLANSRHEFIFHRGIEWFPSAVVDA